MSSKEDRNTGGTRLEFSMRTAMHGASSVSSAICICDNYQSFSSIWLSVAITRWVGRCSTNLRVLSGESSVH